MSNSVDYHDPVNSSEKELFEVKNQNSKKFEISLKPFEKKNEKNSQRTIQENAVDNDEPVQRDVPRDMRYYNNSNNTNTSSQIPTNKVKTSSAINFHQNYTRTKKKSGGN